MTTEQLERSQYLRPAALSLLVTAAVFLFGLFWIQTYQESNEQKEQSRYAALVSAKAEAIERRLTETLMATRMLEVQIRIHKGNRDGFENYAKEILFTVPGVSNIQLAPDGVITDIYPLAGNEKAIGHDILKDDRRRDEARKAVSTHKMTLAGPFSLVQGGVAVIGRQPVFIPDGDTERFWGFASALIHLDSLLDVADFIELENQGYAYELTYSEIGTNKVKTISRSNDSLGELWYQEEIQVPNNIWILRIGRSIGQEDTHSFMMQMLLGLLTIATFAISFHLFRQPEYLRLQIKTLSRKVNRQQATDPLTELPNRQQFFDQIQAFHSQLPNQTTPSALMFIDLDNFKVINDELGHKTGDQILCQVAQRLKAMTRETDLSARIGGDEFAILLKELKNRDEAAYVADKILQSLSVAIPELDNRKVSVSIGVLMIDQDGVPLGKLFRRTDLALQQAKMGGKNCYSFYQPKPTSKVSA